MITAAVQQREVLERDLDILQAMVANVNAYLLSDATSWDMGKPGMPPMTLGGCLMRLRRLAALEHTLYNAEHARLEDARYTFDETMALNVVRFEQRAYQELSARIREWMTYLRDLSHSARLAADSGLYVARVDTRIVIDELVAQLARKPFRLDGRVPRDVAALDRRLKFIWSPGPFVLAAVWQPAYPEERYWWLYGCPRGG